MVLNFKEKRICEPLLQKYRISHIPDASTVNYNIAAKTMMLSSAGVVRASSIFPILSAILLLLGGVCVASSGFYKSKRNIILGGGILFVAAGKTAALLCFGPMHPYFQVSVSGYAGYMFY